jgi:hypothetical protein
LEELVFGVGGGLVGWSGVSGSGVSWGRVGWGRVSGLVCGLLGVFGLSFELDIGGVSVLIGLVVDDLGAAIGESDAVRSGDDVVVGFLVVLKVVVRFLILDVISEAVGLGSLSNQIQMLILTKAFLFYNIEAKGNSRK